MDVGFTVSGSRLLQYDAIMSERDALIQALRRYPSDETLRLIFADWLHEHGEEELESILRSDHGETCLQVFASRPEGSDFDSTVQNAFIMAKLFDRSRSEIISFIYRGVDFGLSAIESLQPLRESLQKAEARSQQLQPSNSPNDQ
jgi:uncharacterized protein (TIGR02996 family)